MLEAPAHTLLRRRRRRLVLAIPAAFAAWLAITTLPILPASATAGTMDTTIITLTGSGAMRSAAAGSRAAKDLRPAPSVAAPGWTASFAVPGGTQAIGVSWDQAPDGQVSVRGRTAGGWTDWDALQADPSDGGDASTRDAGGLTWFGHDGVDQVELEVDEGTLADLQVQTMHYDEPATTAAAVARAEAAATSSTTAAEPAILPRSLYTSKGWATGNSGCSSGPQVASGGIKFAVIHHTVNANTYSEADVPALLASIYAYHTGAQGWCDIAYNFIVDRFGRIWEGRSGGVTKAIIGGHAQGFNTGSMGVSFLGQFEPSASPTAAQPASAALDAAGRLIGWKLGMYGIDPTGTVKVTSGGSNRYPAGTSVTLNRIIGHRDVGYTSCPGQNLYDKLSTIRLVAKSVQGSTTTTTKPPTTTTTTPGDPTYAPFKSAWGVITQQYHDLLRRAPSQSDIDFWAARVDKTWTPGQFIANLVVSKEADLKVDGVIRLYRAYLSRNPDHGGLGYWLNRRDEGRSLVWISNRFAASSEFTSRYGKLSDAAFVDRVYRNVLGRAADSAGSGYWTRKLATGTSRGQVMANFSQSSEYVAKTADGVHVVAIYDGMLQEAVPANEYTLFTAGLKNAATSLTAIATYVYGSDQYAQRVS